MHSGPRHPVEFDRDTLQLSIGSRSITVPDPRHGNEAMLRAYLALVAEVRGTPIGSGIHLRHDDIEVLAEILDLHDAALESILARLLGVSPETAREVHHRIRRHRAVAAAAASLTVGGLALLGATKVSAEQPPPSSAPPAVVVAATAQPDVTTTTVAPASVPDSTPVDVSAAANAPTAPHSSKTHTHPTSDNDVQIGDALVIERGQPPSDPNTQIGDSVTYER